ncbi:MAG: ATP-binding region ATPase domain protein [Gemmatimonadetes bacterium]|nr:ATP-binding region ATPase domain protein [Gemmatimonadota bacterium]
MRVSMENEAPVDILLVDDRPENLLALEAILEPTGQRLVRASSGEEALRKLLTHDFAVILLDVQMPGLNGFETAELIKSRERTRFIPIIFLTAISKEEEYIFRGYSVGAVDYLFKPFQPDILRSKVMVFVDLYMKQRRLQEQEHRLRDAERRELELRHMHELLQSERRYSEVVNSAMDAILTFDHEGKVSLFNAAAERMFRMAAGEVMGKPIETLFPRDMSAEIVQRMCEHGIANRKEHSGLDSERSAHVAEFIAQRSNGDGFPIEASVSCMEAGDERTYTLIVRDVSERNRVAEALRKQAVSLEATTAELTSLNDELNARQEELERAMTARSRFYASMSHELRTPINAVLGYSTLLLEQIYGPLNEKQEEGIRRTHKAAKHLLELVNDVLDLSKIEAGKIDLRLQPVAFPSIVDDLFVTVRPLADQYGSELTLQHSGEPVRIVSDPRRLRQILLNLLSNAIKFGKGEPINVNVTGLPGGGVRIEVSDKGEGILAEDQQRIFEEFVQLGKSQLTEGTGLGLPISRRLAEMLCGTLTVTSNPGEGSVFRLELPASAEPVRPPRPTSENEIIQPASDERSVARRDAVMPGAKELEHAHVADNSIPTGLASSD